MGNVIKLGKYLIVLSLISQEGGSDGKIAEWERVGKKYLSAQRWDLYGKIYK